MRRLAAPALMLCLSALAAACGGTGTPPATPTPGAGSAGTSTAAVTVAPPAASALIGHWTWTASVGGESYAGTMDLSRDGAAWKARVVENTMGEMAVTSIAVQGDTMTVSVEAGGNPSTVRASLQPDGTLAGRVDVSGGEGTFSARKG